MLTAAIWLALMGVGDAVLRAPVKTKWTIWASYGTLWLAAILATIATNR